MSDVTLIFACVVVYIVLWCLYIDKMVYFHQLLFAWLIITLIYIVALPIFLIRQYFQMLNKYRRLFERDYYRQ